MLAIIGGSGLTKLPELEITERKIIRTPYGLTSSPILFGRLGRLDIVFLARHGFSHTIAPHEINYRANIWALHSLGVENIIAISSVVGINPDFENGSLVLPDDLIDYTYGRKDTFFEGQECPVVHTDFFNPYCDELRQELLNITKAHNVPIYDSAVYGCLQGPRRPTRAEIARYRRDGVDVLGMTGMPEAVLARELKMAYTHFCSVSSIDCFDSGVGTEGCNEQTSIAMTKIRQLLNGL
ncbi:MULTISPECIES: S-methyl-5'-thioinosine phosphorylase [Neisseria]|uniref:Purine nucleoside phosphorylase n=4 Tax=Neisseria TaxID=482 RepID=A0ABD7EVH5_NEIPE|nr:MULTISPECIES: S-methyl-5'-thioinosine phosphorylase [Neisseria]OFV31414.1 5'-methylthioadenosine phosphorylase [Neisseria sp. HMSC15G01]QXW89762.1 S-methyl-5'-thioinosine phosphorylase [Neisseria perflava]QXW94963.1 S-methyl-5'-thioinosine phosphorylase [Neisseria sicca ATCC 29256]